MAFQENLAKKYIGKTIISEKCFYGYRNASMRLESAMKEEEKSFCKDTSQHREEHRAEHEVEHLYDDE